MKHVNYRTNVTNVIMTCVTFSHVPSCPWLQLPGPTYMYYNNNHSSKQCVLNLTSRYITKGSNWIPVTNGLAPLSIFTRDTCIFGYKSHTCTYTWRKVLLWNIKGIEYSYISASLKAHHKMYCKVFLSCTECSTNLEHIIILSMLNFSKQSIWCRPDHFGTCKMFSASNFKMDLTVQSV